MAFTLRRVQLDAVAATVEFATDRTGRTKKAFSKEADGVLVIANGHDDSVNKCL